MQLAEIQSLQNNSDLVFSYIKSELAKLNDSGIGLGRLAKICGVDKMVIQRILKGKIGGLKVETLVRVAIRLIERIPSQPTQPKKVAS